MTDLSALFTTPAFINQQRQSYLSSPANRTPLNLHSSPAYRPPTPFTPNTNPRILQRQLYPRTSSPDILISSEAKKIITYASMQDQVAWFQAQNMLECLIKIIIVAAIALIMKYKHIIGFNTLLCVIVFEFLMLGLRHNIFGNGGFRKWVNYSLFGTTIVLSNQIFLFVIYKINRQVATDLYSTHYSLISSIIISCLISLLIYSLPLSTQQQPRSFISSILAYPNSLYCTLKLFYRLKISIVQTYSILLVLAFGGSLAWYYSRQYRSDYQFQLLVGYLVHPWVILAQIITFLVFILMIHAMLWIVGTNVFRIAISVLYSDKNKQTKLPYILELLRVSPTDVFGGYTVNSQQPSLMGMIVKLIRLDLFTYDKKQRKLCRQQLQNIYRHSLAWIDQLLLTNPNSLLTPVYTSKFYNTYYDIFKQFSQSQLRRCAGSLFQLRQLSENLQNMRNRQISLKEDLFFWVKILKLQFNVWVKAVQCCRLLDIVGRVFQILVESQVKKDQWMGLGIGLNIQQICDQTLQLSQNEKLNDGIRSKMAEYNRKSSHLLKKQ